MYQHLALLLFCILFYKEKLFFYDYILNKYIFEIKKLVYCLVIVIFLFML